MNGNGNNVRYCPWKTYTNQEGQTRNSPCNEQCALYLDKMKGCVFLSMALNMNPKGKDKKVKG